MRATVYEICDCMKPQPDNVTDEVCKRFWVTAIGDVVICGSATLLVMSGGSAVAYLIFGLISCTVGNLITYILPALMWIRISHNRSKHHSWRDLWGCYFL